MFIKQKFVLLTCLLPFLMTEGSRVLEKKVNETRVSKTVFSHLNYDMFYTATLDYRHFLVLKDIFSTAGFDFLILAAAKALFISQLVTTTTNI